MQNRGDAVSQATANRARSVFIFATIAIDAIGLGIIIPVLPDVIRRFITDEGAISRTYGWFIATYALLQFLASPLLGNLADRFGRRPVLLMSLLGAAIDYLFMAYAPSLPLLWLGRLISGLTGASYSVASAYIADISNDSNRSKNFGIIGAGFGIGFILGPAIGGWVASYGPEYAFLTAGAFNLLNFAFGLFVLPESLPPERRRPLAIAALNPLRALGKVLGLPSIRSLVFVNTLLFFGGQTHPSIWTLYTQHRYGWTTKQVGFSLTVVGVLNALTQGGFTGVLVKRFGERRLVVVGCFAQSIAFSLFGFAREPWMLYIVLCGSALLWAVGPALQSLICREVALDQQGELQGALMSLMSLVSIANPLVMTTLFSWTSNREGSLYLPGSPYLLSGLLILVAAVLAWHWNRGVAARSEQRCAA